jgi:hypothetical protein
MGHPGRDGTISVLSRSYFWPFMGKMVRRFYKNYNVYGYKLIWKNRKRGFFKPLPVFNRFWNEISIDFIIDLPVIKKLDPSFIMVIINRLFKNVIFEPITSMELGVYAKRFK